MRRYRELFARYPAIAQLSVVQFLGYFGSWFSNVAIYTLLSSMGASAMQIGLIAVAHFLPGVFIAPIGGVIIDKIDTKKLMLGLLAVEIVMTASFLSIDSLEMFWLFALLIFIRMGASSFYFSAEMTLISTMLDAKHLQVANEIHSIIWSLTYASGIAIGGLVVHYMGVQSAFIIDIVLFGVAIAIFYAISVKPKDVKVGDRFMDGLVLGLRYIKTNSLVLKIILLHALIGVTAYDALVAILAKDIYSNTVSIALAIGFLNATRAVALTLGATYLGVYITKSNLYIAILIQAILIVAWGFLQYDFYVSLVGIFLVGVLTTSLWSLTYAMLQEYTDNAFMGRVISYNDMIFLIVSSLTSFLIGFAYQEGVGTTTITVVIGVVFALGGWLHLGIKKELKL